MALRSTLAFAEDPTASDSEPAPTAPASETDPAKEAQPPAATPPVLAPPAPLVAVNKSGDESGEIAALRNEVAALRSSVEADRQKRSEETAPKPPVPKPLGYEAFWPWVTPPEGLSAGAYVQSQYETHQDSQDQLAQDGTTLNKDRFSIRRARASLLGEWEWAAMALELDANTTSGPQVDLRKAEASIQYRPDRAAPRLRF